MKRKKAEQKVSQFLDGELSAGDMEQVQAMLEGDSELRRTEQAWRATRTRLSSLDAPHIQTSEAAWSDVQRSLRSSDGDEQGTWPVFDSRFRWAAASMTGMLLCGMIWLVSNWVSSSTTLVAELGVAGTMGGIVEVEWVEVGLPGATSMVFQDDDMGLTVIWLVESNGEGTGSS